VIEGATPSLSLFLWGRRPRDWKTGSVLNRTLWVEIIEKSPGYAALDLTHYGVQWDKGYKTARTPQWLVTAVVPFSGRE
jgi:hypothetical protein